MIGFLISSIILCLICVILAITIDDKAGCCLFSFFAGVFMILGIAGFVGIKEKNNTPTALDVYQGNTTLEITYRDSIPVDSVVVFKDELTKNKGNESHN